MQITVQDKLSEFHKYLFPTRSEWNNQINGLIAKISLESDRKVLLELLSILPLTEYNRLSFSNISRVLKLMLDGSVTEGRISCVDEEEILLTLLKNISLSDHKQFLQAFEPVIVELINKLDGNNRNKALWILSDLVQTSFGSDIRSVTQCYLRSDGSVYNHVFRWIETMGPDPLYELKLNSSSNKILVSVRNDWWFSDNKSLMELSPYDFVGVELNSELKYRLPLSYQTGDFLIMPALLFYWLCDQRNSDEAWTRFYQGLDLGFTLATVGTYGAAKTALQVGTVATIGSLLDYSLRIGIESLGTTTLREAIEKVSLKDALWTGASTLISSGKMSVALTCLRDGVKSVYEDNASFSDIAGNCCIQVLSTWIINNKLLPQSGRYHELIKKQFRGNTKVVIAKLRKYGITDETILELAQTLFGSTEDVILERINRNIKENTNE